jgi:hypothetical protein
MAGSECTPLKLWAAGGAPGLLKLRTLTQAGVSTALRQSWSDWSGGSDTQATADGYRCPAESKSDSLMCFGLCLSEQLAAPSLPPGCSSSCRPRRQPPKSRSPRRRASSFRPPDRAKPKSHVDPGPMIARIRSAPRSDAMVTFSTPASSQYQSSPTAPLSKSVFPLLRITVGAFASNREEYSLGSPDSRLWEPKELARLAIVNVIRIDPFETVRLWHRDL